jgi:iron(II)-dependent oxidoreductase
MAPSPVDRFASADEMLAALARGAVGPDAAVQPTERIELSAVGGVETAVGSGSGPRGRTFADVGRRWTGIAVVSVVAAVAALLWFRARSVSPGEAGPRARPVARDGAVRLDRIAIRMGSTASEVRAAFDWCRELAGSDCREELYERETPLRRVALSRFDIDRAEVSNAEFADWLAGLPEIDIQEGRVRSGGALLADLRGEGGGIEASGERVRVIVGRERWPVVQVTWRAARDFCRARGGDLPTEAQWERAARGDTGRRFPWGDEPPGCDGVVFGRAPGAGCQSPRRGPEAVDAPTTDVTSEGVRHLGGNVSEWVRDGFVAPYPPCAEPCQDPWVGATGPRVVRGGNWGSFAEMTRAAGRGRADEATTSTQIGFRCVGEET